MAKDYTKVFTEILITLKNINDKMRKVEDEMFDLNCKLTKQDEPKVIKHLIVFKGNKGEKKNENS